MFCNLMRSDFYVQFSAEAAGFLAHMANEKKTSIPTLIELLTVQAIEDEKEEYVLAKLADAVDMNQPRISHDELWAKFQD